MQDPVAQLIRIEVALAKVVRDLSDRILSAPPEGTPESTIWCDYGFKWPAYALAHLHRIEHTDNPLHGQAWCAELALDLADKSVADWRYRQSRGLESSSLEVPNYVLAALFEWLGERIDGERRAAWIACAEAWAEPALRKPFGFTGNYHDAWRFLSLFRLGQALGRRDWCETARLFFHQSIALQTAEGFWEERRHHGPSMRYNGLMLPTLAWMYRLTGDEVCRDAARKLAAFMATYTYPDAITVGPFDGRNSPVLAFFPICAGLELAPEGRVLNARAFRLWHDLGAPGSIRRTAESTRDAVRLAFYTADACVYLSEHVPPAERAAAVAGTGALPVERAGTIENHSAAFDGLLHQNGSWVVALSGQNSDIPRETRNPYRLERESRIEVWHRDARLVLGGGHNLRETAPPYANAVLDTGYAGPARFGMIDEAARRERYAAHAVSRAGQAAPETPPPRELHHLFQSYYMPRVARTRIVDGAPELVLVFGHGIVRFRVHVRDAARCEIEAAWNVTRLDRLCLQFPLVVWLGAEVAVAGRIVRVSGGLFGARVTLELPDGIPSKVHHPLKAHPTFSGRFERDPFRPPFGIALVSCQWTDPPRSGRAGFTLTIERGAGGRGEGDRSAPSG